ncbi:DnaA regulatory inactivator Hda [Alkalimarinus alittae]|uniref:DnaA regulatory inactivator Hda n=1 Tax=Alkalimarinus alittae TaxID=2961619 RepID=A0ABY6MYT6_9ALTE|nr:DnaA regulatory inactivator Hda [Alkalimarinus alittae]UZE95001.1 DnaA regulatory inactivator Hda [Alkalimarinus alittae]
MKSTVQADNPQQLTLSVKLRQDASFENFLGAANQKNSHILLHALNSAELFVYLCGDQSSGKTHLLNASCNALEAQGKRVMFLSLKDIGVFDKQLFDGLESFDAVMLDDIDLLFDDLEREEALFDLYNRLRSNGKMLTVTASQPVANQTLKLADLRSRLGAGLLLQLFKLTDEEKAVALKSKAKDKGLILGDETAAYIMKRSDRSLDELFALLDQLDDASLSAQRRLTVPFVKSVLGW